VQADLRRRILRAFVGRGPLERCVAKEMLAYKHGGFSVDAGVCIEAQVKLTLFHGHLTVMERGVMSKSKPPHPAEFRQQIIELARVPGAWLSNGRAPLTLLLPVLAYAGAIGALWLLRSNEPAHSPPRRSR
jgi:hypothetical protein